MARIGVFSLILALGLCVGCDDHDEVPASLLNPSPLDATTQPTLPDRPTTQELETGSRVWLALDTLPLRIQVPASWKITQHGEVGAWLEGPTPHGDAHIALKLRPTIEMDQFRAYLKGIEKEKADPKAMTTHRIVGPMHVVDRRSFLQASVSPVLDTQGLPVLDDKGEVRMQTIVPMRWWINLAVPFDDKRVDQYELNFIMFTKDQHELDRAFLEKILGTLDYIGQVPPTQPSIPATAPAGR
jgi:hypothetical protein